MCPGPKVRSQVPAGDGEPQGVVVGPRAKQPWGEVRSSWTCPYHQPVPPAAPVLRCSRQAPASPSMLRAGHQLLPVMVLRYHRHRGFTSS